MPQPPLAFLSYSRYVDEHDLGRISEFRVRLEGEVRVQTGNREFRIFQDREGIGWGESWSQVLTEALEESIFLIPVITPGYFTSEPCRQELGLFRERERLLGRDDLILPVHYVETDQLVDPEGDELAELIASRQWVDWHEFRFLKVDDERVARKLAETARKLKAAMRRVAVGRAERVTVSAPLPPSILAPAASTASIAVPPRASGPNRVDLAELITEWPAPSEVIVVDPSGAGGFKSLRAATIAAKSGARIEVRPGYYQESLFLNKPLQILGVGELGDVVIESDKNTPPICRLALPAASVT